MSALGFSKQKILTLFQRIISMVIIKVVFFNFLRNAKVAIEKVLVVFQISTFIYI